MQGWLFGSVRWKWLNRALMIVCYFALFQAGLAGASDWPEFRGPLGNGHAPDVHGLPVHCSESENITWKTEIPYQGWSTPVTLDGQIWLTTATEEGNDFYAICVDADSGKILFNKKVFHEDNPEPLGNTTNCYASPSPVIEPGRVFVHFGTYGTACLDTASAKVLWERRDLPCRHYRGPGSSPIIFENFLMLSFDGVDQQYVTALDKFTGETIWKTERSTVWTDLDENGEPIREGDRRKAFCTPIIIEAGGRVQMISLGSSMAFSYDPWTGQEIWKTRNEGHSASPRPVFGNGIVYAATGHGQSELWAIRADGEGDVTDTRVVWINDSKDVPQQPSPILVDGLIYMVGNHGYVTCLDAATGETIWREPIGGSYMASPIYADGKLYFSSTQGRVTVLKAGRAYTPLAKNELDEGFMASPAVTGNALILRTKTHLYRIDEKGAEGK